MWLSGSSEFGRLRAEDDNLWIGTVLEEVVFWCLELDDTVKQWTPCCRDGLIKVYSLMLTRRLIFFEKTFNK